MKEQKPLTPTSLACWNFLSQDGKRSKVTAIIAPITVEQIGETTRIGYACSRGKYCFDANCIYAKATKQTQQEQEEWWQPYKEE